jgi:hypothetical protein
MLRDVMKANAPELLLELDGPDVHPATVEPLSFLQLAESWLRLMVRIGEASGLRLHGLLVRDKCIAIATRPNNVRTAQAVAGRLARIIGGTEDAPPGADAAAEDLRRHLRALPKTHQASVRMGNWVKTLLPPTPIGPLDRWERTEMRVQPLRVGAVARGGISAKLANRGEGVSFTVSVSTDAHARTLGANLFRDIDVELRICRGDDDIIKGGTIIDVHPVDAVEPVSSWRAWFKENADGWEDVENVLEELGRGH